MRICYIGDANAIHTQRWVEWFSQVHEASVISTTPQAGLEPYRVDTLPGSGTRGRLLRSVVRVRQLLNVLRPDVIHCHFINEAGWFGAASGWRPLIITAWGSDIYRAPVESRIARWLNPWAVRQAQIVTCDSEDQARVLRSWNVPNERLSVVGWGVDLEEFHPGVDGRRLRERLDIPPEAPLLLSPRQWYVNSNIPTVVAAHERLGDDVYLLLKRASEFEPDRGLPVEQAIMASTARDRIRVLDEIPADQLPGLYAAADVAVSLCTTDGTPVSLLEAMASGCPVVALRNESLSEWVDGDGGRLVGTLDPARVAHALAPFLLDPGLRGRAGQHNRAVVAARADRAKEFGRMAEIYERLGTRQTVREHSHVH